MTNLVQHGNEIRLQNFTSVNQKLAPGNYILCKDAYGNFYLRQTADFDIPSKLYGDFSYLDRYLRSYEVNSDKNLGILFSGVKGSGKTIAAQLFCYNSNKPVIMITEEFIGINFEEFISNPLFNDSIIFIDEFEKIYNSNNSNSLLALMDGIYNTRLIFLFTVNNHQRINDKLQNRLSRIKYHKLFDTLDLTVIDEVLDDLLENKAFRQDFIDLVSEYQFITMDILCSLIKEVNIFNEPPKVCASYLNLTNEDIWYEINVVHKGRVYPCSKMHLELPLEALHIEYDSPNNVDEETLELVPNYEYVDIHSYDLTYHPNGFVFSNEHGVKIEFIKIKSSLAF